jgi:hypothetical protein
MGSSFLNNHSAKAVFIPPGSSMLFNIHRDGTLSHFRPTNKRTKDKTMTYNYRLRSAIAATFASAFTLMFAVAALTGNAYPLMTAA